MATRQQTANSVYRDYVVDGVATSGPNEPRKNDIRAYESMVNTDIDAALAQGATAAASAAASASSAAASAASAAAVEAALGLQSSIYASPDAGVSGLIGVQSLVGGSGGTNGTFALIIPAPGAGGVQAVGNFTVAGGAVTAVTITTAGSNYAADVALTNSAFAASAGLTGASVTLKRGVGVADGAYFWVVSSSAQGVLDLYLNSAWVPVAQLRTLFNGADTWNPEPFLAALGGGRGTLKALWYDRGPNSLYAPGVLASWTSLDANATQAVLHSTISSLADNRPVIQDKGIYFGKECGLRVNSGILAKTTNCAIHYVFEIGAVTQYATKADMLASTGHVDGDIAQVTGDANTTYSPDVSKVMNGFYADANLVNGFWVYDAGSAGWAQDVSFKLWALDNPANFHGLFCYVNRLGQIFIQLVGLNGAVLTVLPIFSIGRTVIGNGRHIMSVLIEPGSAYNSTLPAGSNTTIMRLFLDGQESGAIETYGINVTDLSNLWINGADYTALTVVPVRGWRQWIKAFSIIDDPTWEGFRDSHNALADYAGVPRISDNDQMWGILGSGQSWKVGATDVPQPGWVTPSGWNGMVTPENATHSGEQIAMTRGFLPRVFATQGSYTNYNIGPLLNGVLENVLYTIPAHTFAAEGESCEFGMMKWILNYPTSPKVDWLLVNSSLGATNLAQLSAESIPPLLLQNLKGRTGSSLTVYEQLLQGVIYARDFAARRGKRYVVKFFFWQQGHSDLGTTTYVTDFLAYYDKLNVAIKRITGQADDVICFFPQVNYSILGTSNDGITGAGHIDQAFLDIVDARGTRPLYCIGPMYQITNHIHPYRQAHRWIGEILGKIACRVLFDGVDWQPLRPKSFTLGANYVDIQPYLMAGRQIAFADSNANNIDHRVQIGGVDTYGFEYSGGGLVINAAPTIRTTVMTNDTIRVPLSGAPASGHIISYTGANSRFGNVHDDDPAVAYYPDQDWTVPIVSGSPTWRDGALNDLRNWMCAFRHVL